MTHPLIRSTAKELAGAFYEQNRSERFRYAFPTVEAYLGGWQRVSEGRVKKIAAGWMHHVVLARRLLVEMLKQPDARVTQHMKDQIAEALIEDHGKSQRFGKKIQQRMERDDDKAQSRLRLG